MAKKEKPEEQVEQESAIEPVTEENKVEPVAERVEEEKRDEAAGQTFGQVMRRLVLAFLRLIIIVAVIGGCGAAVYYGVPFLYDKFISPVEQTTSQMTDINRRLGQSEFQITDLEAHIATLEAGQTAQSDSLTEADTRLESLEGSQTDLGAAMTDLELRIQNLEEADARRDESLAELTYQADLLQAMEMLARGRLFLYQSNFGLARLDVQAARDVIAGLASTAPQSKQKDLSEALFRLDLALKNLPDFPVAASDDLDIAWQILLDGYPVPATGTPTPFSTVTPQETGTPIPAPTVTPTP
jgi:hypothetical protein